MRCADCEHWIIRRETHYEDGSVIVNQKSPDGKGRCGVLKMDTDQEFGCLKFSSGSLHATISYKAGAPWHHHYMGPCPDCGGLGSQTGSACRRCTGTANVRYYDDGYVGEERTREHPKEKEMRERGEPRPPINPVLDGTVLKDLKYREKDRDTMGAAPL